MTTHKGSVVASTRIQYFEYLYRHKGSSEYYCNGIKGSVVLLNTNQQFEWIQYMSTHKGSVLHDIQITSTTVLIFIQ